MIRLQEIILICFAFLTFFIFLLGSGSLSLVYELTGLIIIWLVTTIYYLFNLKDKLILLFFNLMIFLFLIGRPIINIIIGNDGYGTILSQKIGISIIALSLGFITIGSLVADCFRVNSKSIVSSQVLQAGVEKLSFNLFLVTWIFSFVNSFANFWLNRGVSFESIYDASYTRLPSIFSHLSQINLYVYLLFLSTLPRKNKTIFLTSLVILTNIPDLMLGVRNEFSSLILFLIIYFLLRHYYYANDEKWFSKNIKLAMVFLIPMLIIVLNTINYSRASSIRSYQEMPELIEFVYLQGTSFDTIIQGIENEELLTSSTTNYTFGTVIDSLRQNEIAKRLNIGIDLGYGNNLNKAFYSNNLAHRISYIVLGNRYLQGFGRGSSYIIENYLDFGYPGVAIFGFILGFFMKYLPILFKKSISSRFIFLNICLLLFLTPRNNSLNMLIFFLDIKFYFVVFIFYLYFRNQHINNSR